jgi:hypothetical protein
LYEASRADFNNLFDFVKAEADRTDERFNELHVELRARFVDLHTAIKALVPHARVPSGPRPGKS